MVTHDSNKNRKEIKIYFTTRTPFTKRDYHRFGVDFLIKSGCDVSIWHIVLEECPKAMPNNESMYDGDNYLKMSLEEFKIRTHKNKRYRVYIILQAMNEIGLYLAKNGCHYIIMEGLGGIPTPPRGPGSYLRSYMYLANYLIKNGIVTSFNKYCGIKAEKKKRKDFLEKYSKCVKSTPPIMIVTSTKHASHAYLKPLGLNNNYNIQYVHAMDYDRYIECNLASGKSERCILYCDSGYHGETFDALYLDLEFETHRKKSFFFEQIEKLFLKLEDHYGVPVVVAGHPHTKYEEGDFCGRQIVFDRTCELAKNAVCFVMTTSTAFSFAVLYDLPILRVVNRDFKKVRVDPPDLYDLIKQEALYFGNGFLDLDHVQGVDKPWLLAKRMRPESREEYITKFIIDNYESRNKLIIEYVEEFLAQWTPRSVSSSFEV